MGAKPTDAELELLTDEEREALEFDENATGSEKGEATELKPGEVQPGQEAAKPDPDPKPGTEEEKPDPEKVPDEKPSEPPDKKPDDEVPPKAADNLETLPPDADAEQPQVPKVDFVPKVGVAMPDEVKQRITQEADRANAGLVDQLKQLNTQYDEGDLDTVEYLEQADKVRLQINENRMDVRDTIRTQWQEESVSAQRWDAEQDAFFKIYPQLDAPKYATNGNLISGDPVLYGALDAACAKVAKDNPGLSGIDLLIKAKGEVDASMGIKSAAAPGTRPSAKRPGKNLGDIPPAAPESVGDGEFANLDKLGGDALEDALSKMSSAQRERYLLAG